MVVDVKGSKGSMGGLRRGSWRCGGRGLKSGLQCRCELTQARIQDFVEVRLHLGRGELQWSTFMAEAV